MSGYVKSRYLLPSERYHPGIAGYCTDQNLYPAQSSVIHFRLP